MEKIMIIAGEASGDIYGGTLVKALKERVPGLRVFGMGGERMRASGVEILSDIKDVSVIGVVEIFSHLRNILKVFRMLRKKLAEERPNALILIDFPGFNLRLAERVRDEGIPIIYYISPQIWAWRPERIKKIARLVDKMLVALPFEADIYREAGVDAVFVGHPLLDEPLMEFAKKDDGIKKYNLDPERPVLALLPGSRKREIELLLPVMLEVMDILKPAGVQAIIPVAPTVDFSIINEMVKGKDIILAKGKAWEVLGLSDVALITSGTATLQAAIQGVPMVIVYKLSPLTYLLGKILVKVKNIGIVNILAGKEIAPEFIQSDIKPEKIAGVIKKILEDSSYRDGIKRDLLEVKEKLGSQGASDRAAQEIIGFLTDRIQR